MRQVSTASWHGKSDAAGVDLLYLLLSFRLDVTEKKLQDITAEQGTNVNNLVALVKENGEILEKMKVRSLFRFLYSTHHARCSHLCF